MKNFGCAYYPEAWDRKRWKTDFQQMRDLGVTMIRMGEFNWGKFEPDEGVFDFSDYLNLLDLAHSFGIRVMMCTPTAAIPRWMHARFPEVLKLRANGTRTENGVRQSTCHSNPKFRFFAERIVRKMGQAFRNHPAITVWQLDNELSLTGATGFCICDSCEKRFRAFLKGKYRTIEALNHAWNGAFWSSDFNSWDDVVLPVEWRWSWKFDFVQFQSGLILEMISEHYKILKELNPDWRITSNNPEMIYSSLRIDKLFSEMDFAACDTYIQRDNIFSKRMFWDFYRGITGEQKKFMIAETGAFNTITTEDNSFDALKPWFWEMIARGADSLLYFRWRQSVMGEQDHPAILPWDGCPGIAYHKIKELKCEFDSLPDDISELSLEKTHTAILYDAATGQYHTVRKDDSLFITATRLHIALSGFGINPDFLFVSENLELSAYKVIFIPVIEHVSSSLAKKLKEFVCRGGTLFSSPRLNLMESNGCYRTEPFPFDMTDLFGLKIHDTRKLLQSNADQNTGVFDISSMPPTSVGIECFGVKSQSEKYVECIEPLECVTLETLNSTCFSGAPLMTRNSYGRGSAFYLSTYLDIKGVKECVRRVLEHAGFTIHFDLPPEVVRLKRGKYVIYVNSFPRSVEIAAEHGDILLGSPTYRNSIMNLKPYEVLVLKNSEIELISKVFAEGSPNKKDKSHIFPQKAQKDHR